MGAYTNKDIQSESPSNESNLVSVKNNLKTQLKTPEQTNTFGKIIEEINIHPPKNSKFVVQITMDISTKDLVEHAIELWRMEQRLNKVITSLEDDSQQTFFTRSIQKLKRYLEKNNIEIVEHTNQKFNYGRNLDVLLVEKSPDITETIIKETKEPTILWKNHVVHKGKVIIIERTNKGDRHE